MQKDDDLVQEVAQAAMLYTKARDHFHDVLHKYVDNQPYYSDHLLLQRLLSTILPLKAQVGSKPCGEIPLHEPRPCILKAQVKKEKPDPISKRTDHPRPKKVVLPDQPKLGNVTRIVVRGLLSTFKERVLFTAKDAAVCRPAPHNTRDGVYSALMCLVKRGLIKDEGDGCFSIPDASQLWATIEGSKDNTKGTYRQELNFP